MGHDHHTGKHAETGNLKIAFFLNIVFTIIEIIGGILTNSVAILSDALHDLGDSLSLGLAWYFQTISKKGSDVNYSYGYKRFSVLGAAINAIILIIGSVFILKEAFIRILHPESPDAMGMIWLAILGVIFNGVALLQLKKGNSLNEKVISLHFIEDVLGWIGVLIGALVMYFYDFPIIDPILSILISCYMFYNVFKNLKETAKIMLQGTPTKINQDEIRNYLKKLENVEGIHDLHLWTMDGEYVILSVHIVLTTEQTLEQLFELKKKIRHDLSHKNIEHVTIEFELVNNQCEMDDSYN